MFYLWNKNHIYYIGESMKKYILLLIAGLLVGITTNIGHPITPYYINQL